jgi:hypothetical protein
MDKANLGKFMFVTTYDLVSLLNTFKSHIIVHNTQTNLYFLFSGENFVQNLRMKNFPKSFTAENLWVARFFLGQYTKAGKNIPNVYKNYQMPIKIYPMIA